MFGYLFVCLCARARRHSGVCIVVPPLDLIPVSKWQRKKGKAKRQWMDLTLFSSLHIVCAAYYYLCSANQVFGPRRDDCLTANKRHFVCDFTHTPWRPVISDQAKTLKRTFFTDYNWTGFIAVPLLSLIYNCWGFIAALCSWTGVWWRCCDRIGAPRELH